VKIIFFIYKLKSFTFVVVGVEVVVDVLVVDVLVVDVVVADVLLVNASVEVSVVVETTTSACDVGTSESDTVVLAIGATVEDAFLVTTPDGTPRQLHQMVATQW
jgi:hypothetical protein